jgi:DNA polymerase
MMSGMSEKEAKDAVNLYRSKMKSVKKLWSDYTTDIITSYDTENRFTVDLPSGRTLDYGRLKPVKQNDKIQYVAMMPKNGKRVPVKLWGGLVAENASQALARDIFSHMLCKINDIGNGVELIMHVHDEVVVEVDADKAEWALNEIIQIMSTPPDWIPDIPVSAEGQILTKYEK